MAATENLKLCVAKFHPGYAFPIEIYDELKVVPLFESPNVCFREQPGFNINMNV